VTQLVGQNDFRVVITFPTEARARNFVEISRSRGVAYPGRCFSKRLLETGARRLPGILSDLDYTLRLTPVGLYHIQELAGSFSYLDAVIVDTPILDKDVRNLIKDAHSLEERLRRAGIFCDYLDSCWRAIEGDNLPFEWPERAAGARRLMSTIGERVI
jgi:hypothetical protein